MHSNVTIKNVSWPHFSWPTLYNDFCHCYIMPFIYVVIKVNGWLLHAWLHRCNTISLKHIDTEFYKNICAVLEVMVRKQYVLFVETYCSTNSIIHYESSQSSVHSDVIRLLATWYIRIAETCCSFSGMCFRISPLMPSCLRQVNKSGNYLKKWCVLYWKKC